jgi:thioredoxin-related protein
MRGRSGARAIFLAGLAVLGPGPAGGAAIAWRAWDEGLQAARQLDRPILVDVCTRWSRACKRMERHVYSRGDVREYLGRAFVAVRLDAEAEAPARYGGRRFTQRSLASHFRVSAYPTTVFLRADGRHLISVPGYVEADRFLKVLRYVGEGHLERGLGWEEFQAQPRH